MPALQCISLAVTVQRRASGSLVVPVRNWRSRAEMASSDHCRLKFCLAAELAQSNRSPEGLTR